MKLEPDLGPDVPAHSRTNYARSKGVISSLWVPKHDCEVLRHIVEDDQQWMLASHILDGVKDTVGEGLLVFG